jgi:Tfp pilus assembly protein PilO
MSEEIKKVESSKKVIVVLLIAIIGLIGGIAYLSKLYSDKIQELNKALGENTKLKSDLNEVNKSIGSVVDIEGRSNDLKTNLTNMLNNYDELIKMDKSKSDSLNIEKSKIQGLLNQINTLKSQIIIYGERD